MNEMIFGGASTFSKMHCNYPETYPEYVDGCEGQAIKTLAGKPLFDTVSSLGARLIDYDDAGGMLSLPSIKEQVLAERLREHFPFIEMVRYGCNGADATEGAIRYARAFTGRPLVFSVGYHSCQSAFTFNTPPALGCINGLVRQFKDVDDLITELLILPDDHTVGAVIIEPVMLDLNVAVRLSQIRSITAEKNIVLIFDEIITGFRVPKRSISTWYEIHPDLILLGKALGGGYPLSIIGGRRDIMNVSVFHSYTFAALPKALKNAIEICKISDDDFFNFWEKASLFFRQFNSLDFEIKLKGYPTRATWDGPEELKYTFWQEMQFKGFLLGPAFFPRTGWLPADYAHLFEKCVETIESINKNKTKLVGRIPEPIFRRNR